MEFRILGPLEVLEGDRPLALGRLKERTVLGVLLLHANEFVSRERLIDELWGAAPPPTATKAVNVYVSKLRKTLSRNGHDPIATADGGYRLVVDPESLDAERVRGLVASANECMATGDSEAAAQLLHEALALWRGPTLAGLPLESFGREEVAQLDELRLTALMDRIDCDLAQGRHERVLGELQVLVREHPLRERLRAQQILALYRADRQADALEAYQRARHDLIDELGIEPSESLQRLQQAILQHDPALEAPAGTATVNGAARTAAAPPPTLTTHRADGGSRRRFRPRRRQLVIAALVLVAASAAAVATVATVSTSTRATRVTPRVLPNSLVRIDPATGKVLSESVVGIEPGPMAFSGDTLWFVNRGDRTISRYDLRTRKLSPPFAVSSRPYDIAADADGNAWVSGGEPAITWILHTASGTGTSAAPLETTDIRVPLAASGAEAVGAGYLWVIPGQLSSPAGDDRVSLIDVRTRRVAATIRLGREATAIAYGYGSAWIGTYDRRQSTAWLAVVRPGSPRPESVRLETGDGWGPLAIAVGAGNIWVLTSADTLMRIDPETQRIVGRIRMSDKQPVLLAAGAGSVWTANLTDYSVSQIDPRRNRVVRTIPLGSYASIPCGIAASHSVVWVAIGDAYCDTANR